jgi:Cu+-exporting ATPase
MHPLRDSETGHRCTAIGDSSGRRDRQAINPVCGMTVSVEAAEHHAQYQRSRHYFCSAHCLDAFSADPDRWTGPRRALPERSSSGIERTCPMHPEYRQIGPGSCAICEMALEPLEISCDPTQCRT